MGETEGLRPSVDPLFKATGNQDPLVMFSWPDKKSRASRCGLAASSKAILHCPAPPQQGQRGTEDNGSLMEAQTGSLGAGALCSSKRSRRAQPLPRPLVPAEGRQSLCPYTRQTEPEGSTFFPASWRPEVKRERASQEEPLSICTESWSLPCRAQCSHFV